MNKLLDGEVAVVTGAGTGIGEAIALGFADHGAAVAILDVNGEAGEDTAKAITAGGGRAISLAVDVTDREACHGAAAEVAAQLGDVSVLVNNAGINRRNHVTADRALLEQDWDDILAINLKGAFNVTKAFLEPLRRTKGRVVNIGSIQSRVHVQWPNSAAYTTSKHGVLGLTRALATELGPDGVRVNAIGPGLIETAINKAARDANPDMVAMVLDHTPLKRTGKTDDIVGPAVFLASDMSAFITGSIIFVDGGFTSV